MSDALKKTDPEQVEPTSDPTNAAAKSPNPFDLDGLALPQSFAETVGVKKLLSHVPLGKSHPFVSMLRATGMFSSF